jgi:hypothetical protein
MIEHDLPEPEDRHLMDRDRRLSVEAGVSGAIKLAFWALSCAAQRSGEPELRRARLRRKTIRVTSAQPAREERDRQQHAREARAARFSRATRLCAAFAVFHAAARIIAAALQERSASLEEMPERIAGIPGADRSRLRTIEVLLARISRGAGLTRCEQSIEASFGALSGELDQVHRIHAENARAKACSVKFARFVGQRMASAPLQRRVGAASRSVVVAFSCAARRCTRARKILAGGTMVRQRLGWHGWSLLSERWRSVLAMAIGCSRANPEGGSR